MSNFQALLFLDGMSNNSYLICIVIKWMYTIYETVSSIHNKYVLGLLHDCKFLPTVTYLFFRDDDLSLHSADYSQGGKAVK